MTPFKHKVIQYMLEQDGDEATSFVPDMDTLRTAGTVLKTMGAITGIHATPRSGGRIHRMRAGATAPYYLSDRGKSQWHKNRAERGVQVGVYAGAGGWVAKNPFYSNTARHIINQKFGVDIPSEHINKAGSFMYAGAAASGVYAGYHAVKARQYKKMYTNRERAAAAKHADKGLHGDFYYRHQGGKQVKVRKGKRK